MENGLPFAFKLVKKIIIIGSGCQIMSIDLIYWHLFAKLFSLCNFSFIAYTR